MMGSKHSAQRLDVFVGSYSAADDPGVHWIEWNLATGELTIVDSLAGIENPSFLAVHPSGGTLYCVSETQHGQAVVVQVDRSHRRLCQLGRVSTGGAAPCYIQLTADARFMTVANYEGGSICIFPLQDRRAIGERSAFVRHQGHGTRSDRQAGPHPHSAVPDAASNWVLVPDLGLDTVVVYHLDASTGQLCAHSTASTPAGTGPRHLVFHPFLPMVYVCCELDSTLVAYDWDPSSGRLSTHATYPLLPRNFSAPSTAADVHITPDGRFLYASNRGHDTLACYGVDAAGHLQYLCHVPTHGRTPRHFAISPRGDYLMVANQDSDDLRVFALDERGIPRPTGDILTVHSPVCIRFWPE
ncbi:MAG: lactonase family protein [Alicyclobacillus shizuokensis]|nr:lactonase family protein [Alicyclobacillus shizuokensis]